MSLYKIARFFNKASQDSSSATALILGMTLGSGYATHSFLEDDVDHLGVPAETVQVTAQASSQLDTIKPLIRSFNILQKEKELDELKQGPWQDSSDQMKKFQGENYALTTAVEKASDRWLGSLLQNDQISEVDFSNLLTDFKKSGSFSKDFAIDQILPYSNTLHECQISSADNGISKTEAKEIASCMIAEEKQQDNLFGVTLVSFMASFFGVMVYGSGTGKKVENWTKDRAARRRRKPQIKRN